jgi:hypothetical protein
MTLFSRFAPKHSHRSRLNKSLAFGTLAALCMTLSCARQPPNGTAFSGKRLRVIMTFRQAINPIYHYFLVINKQGTFGTSITSGAIGPVPVIVPAVNGSFGNGFATGSDSSAHGFTDYVEFTQGNFNLYHIGQDTLQGPFIPEGHPVSVTPYANGATSLQFDLDLGQLVYNTNNLPLSPADAANIALQIQYLQVNIIATDTTSTSPDLSHKEVDALGDTSSRTGQQNFLELDLRTPRIYQSSDNSQSAEPSSNDVFVYPQDSVGTGDASLDLVDWSMQIVQQ